MKSQELDKLIDQVAELILSSRRIVVFTGAGVSTESGIPDFRSPGGLWTKHNPDDFTYQKFLSDPEARRKAWGLYRELWAMPAAPNPAHYAIAELERLGKLDCVITQNIDGLHQQAGNSEDKVIQLHGTFGWVRCLDCGQRYPAAEIRARLEQGTEVPDCERCHGILKSATISFGEPMPVRETSEAERRSRNCDLCIVIGSSLVVYPAALMPHYALESGARLVIINQGPTPMDQMAHVRIYEKAGEAMSKIMERVQRRLASP